MGAATRFWVTNLKKINRKIETQKWNNWKNPGATKFIIKYNNEKIEMLLGALIVLLIEDAELKTN